MTQYTGQGVTREQVYIALEAQIQSVLNLKSFIRGWPIMSGVDSSQSPAGYLHQESSRPVHAANRRLPPKYVDRARLWVMVAQQPSDQGIIVSPSTQLNNLRDLLDTALQGDQGDQYVCTLGGLVEHCWIVDDTIFEAVTGLLWTLFRTHIELQYFSVNNQM